MTITTKILRSLERIDHYLKINHEPAPTEGGYPPAYWPSSGDLRVENLSARYSPDGPEVLHNISFHVKSGERIGVGKSAHAYDSSMLTCVPLSGPLGVRKGR